MSNMLHKLTWRVMGASVTGASHIASNKPNQDAILCSPDNKDLPLILAIADGHGSYKNFRSDIGANFAVEIAVEELRNFASSLVGVSSPTALKDRYERVPRQIVTRWREKTTAHWKDHKPTDEFW